MTSVWPLRSAWVGSLAGMLVLGACGEQSATPAKPAGHAPVNPAAAPAASPVGSAQHVDLQHPPVRTFAAHCARCHGPEGAFYGDGFADHAAEELHEISREMMTGPAFLTPTEADVAAMTAYHRALRRQEPFVAVINGSSAAIADPESLELDVSPRATVTRTRVTDGVEISAQRGERTTRIRFPATQWSHTGPD